MVIYAISLTNTNYLLFCKFHEKQDWTGCSVSKAAQIAFFYNIGKQTDFLIIATVYCNQSSELKNLNKKVNLGNAEQCRAVLH